MKPRPLSVFLARLIWLSVLPPVAVAAWLAVVNILNQQEQIRRQAADLAHNFATAIDHHLNARIRALNILAMSPLVDDPDRWPELYAEARGYHESFGGHVILADTGNPMRMLFNTRSPLGTVLPPLPRPAGHAAAPAALASGRPAVGDTFVGPVAEDTLIAIAVPRLRAGTTTHLLLTILETKQFQARLDQEALPGSWAITMRDGRGDVIARRAPPGFDGRRDVDDEERFVARSTVSPWSVAVEIPRAAVHMPLLSSAIALALAILAATAASVFGSYQAGRRLGSQVAALVAPASSDKPPRIAEIAAVRQKLADAAAQLQRSEALFATTIEQATVGIAVIALGGRCLVANRALSALFGFSREAMRTKTWQQLTHPDEVAVDEQHIARLMAGETSSYTREKRFVACDDTVFWAHLGVTLIRKPTGEPDYFIAVVENIQARKEIEAALLESSQLLTDMAAMAHVGGWTFEPATGKGTWTPEALRIHDLPEDAPFSAAAGLEYYIGEHRRAIEAAIRTAVEKAVPYDLELEMQTRTGRRKWVRTIGHPVVVDGKVVRMHGAIQDITDRKLAGMALVKSEQYYREVVEGASSAIMRWSGDGTITFFNAYTQHLFGWDRASLLGQHIGVLIPEHATTGDDLSGLVADIAAHPERHRYVINENVRRDGSRIWMAWTNRAIRDLQGNVVEILALGNDITEHKLLLEELKSRNEELERFNRAAVGRELRMVELKRTINELSRQLGQPPPFDLSFTEEP
ncbi:PAS domain S-box protein [Desulfobulbus elongatus]|uniref:PAS domain S-box protein n=1 Tax=Desulfobulbus elongatus TaxID=53332 RepID=UPI0004842FCA|nr:PAS domain S-box protein [Desulfobulbus elongatus]